MNEQGFFERRRPEWIRLMELCDKADRSPKDLTSQELRQLIQIYRRVSTDLAVVRTRSTNPSLTEYLNDLAGRAYAVVYREPRRSIASLFWDSITLSARTVRRYRYFVLASFLLFFGSAFLVFGLNGFLPHVNDFFVPPGLLDPWKENQFPDRTSSQSSLMTGFYAGNNPRVAIIAGSIGAATFGLLSIYMIATNGAMLGALAAIEQPRGLMGHMIATLGPHGVPELSGIMISGAAGLVLGYALINPGRRTRGAALRAVGRDAVVLLATSIVMMFIAAPIEGFISYSNYIPEWWKGGFALASLIAWLFFWSSFGKVGDEAAAAKR